MTVNVLDAARHMAARSDWSLSNLKLQKLLYLSHMFYMGRHDGEPLVHGTFEAWDYGPVHVPLYHRVKVYGSDPVTSLAGGDILDSASPEATILDEAYDALGDSRAGQLINATHKEGGAWANNYIPGARGVIIPNEDILAEYIGMDND
jgi:uncharacterized phage-associated protein